MIIFTLEKEILNIGEIRKWSYCITQKGDVRSNISNSDMKECLLTFPRSLLDVTEDAIAMYVPIVTPFLHIISAYLC